MHRPMNIYKKKATTQFGPSKTATRSHSPPTSVVQWLRLNVSNTSNHVVAYPGWDYIHILNSCVTQNTNEGQRPESREF